MSSVVVVGNLVEAPELRFTPSGTATCKFTVAENRKNGNESVAHYYDVTCWKSLAENCSESLAKGMRVIVSGQLEQQRWETDGQKRSKVCIVAWNVGPDLSYATCTVERQGDGE